MTEWLHKIGLTRFVLSVFLIVLWAAARFATDLDFSLLFSDCLVRTGMNGVLVLALLPAVRAGVGLNFGLPLGIVCGLFSLIMMLNAEMRGVGGLIAAMGLSLVLGAIVGIPYAKLLDRVRGQEMMVSIYVGFSAVAGASIMWLSLPISNTELIWPLGGEGLRNTIVLTDYFAHKLDQFGAISFGAGFVPTGLLLFWLGTCALMALFLRTRVGLALTAAGSNPKFAVTSGINVDRMRTLGVAMSTALAALGIVVFSQSYGFVQLYKAPLLMAFPAVAALLIGGATVGRASVSHVIVGTFLFQSVLTTSLPLVNNLVADAGDGATGLENIPEIARLIISNGIILYALTRRERM